LPEVGLSRWAGAQARLIVRKQPFPEIKTQRLLLAATLAGLALGAVAPARALNVPIGLFDALMIDSIDRRNRRPRVPGGSGCDVPRDLTEHPEGRV
jgi:hypothetical protein